MDCDSKTQNTVVATQGEGGHLPCLHGLEVGQRALGGPLRHRPGQLLTRSSQVSTV